MFAGLELARKLERAEGLSGASFVDAHALARPASGACRTEIAGAICLFDGTASPVTQTFGLGMGAKLTPADMDAIEAFFRQRGAPVFHEVSPLAGPSVMDLLNERGYRPFEFTSMLVRELNPCAYEPALGCPVRPARRDESGHWSALAAKGWEQPAELAGFFEDMAAIYRLRDDTVSFYAEVNGTLAATGSLTVQDDVALLAGASTAPEFRGHGAQQSLLAARLYYAAQHGCALACMGALPGSASQRNAERNGFQVAYTRLKWKL